MALKKKEKKNPTPLIDVRRGHIFLDTLSDDSLRPGWKQLLKADGGPLPCLIYTMHHTYVCVYSVVVLGCCSKAL